MNAKHAIAKPNSGGAPEKKSKRVTSQATIALLAAAASGDQSAHQALMMQYQPLVRLITGQRGANLSFADRADLVQEGAVALAIAIERCRPHQRLHFASYAGSWIRGQLAKFIEDQQSLVLGPARPIKRASKVKADDAVVASYAAAEREVFDKNPVEEEDRHDDDLVTEPRNNRPANVRGRVRRDLNFDEIPQHYLSHANDPEALLIAREEYEAEVNWVRSAIACLEKSDRALIVARWLRQPPLSLTALARQQKTSISRLALSHQRALRRLRTELEKRRKAQRSTRQRSDRRRAPQALGRSEQASG